MAYTTIDDPSAYFQIALYTGNGGSHTITNDGNSDLQPDLLWIKARNSAQNHQLHDSSRGADKGINSNNSNAEYTDANAVTGFTSDGFTMNNSYGSHNSGSNTYVAWQWAANGGTTTSVSGTGTTAGSTKAGTYQANTTAGFSIVTFSTGVEDAGDHRIEHGLGVVPNFIITKDRNGSAYQWYLYHHKGTDDNDYLRIDTNPVVVSGSGRNVFDGSDFTSTYFEMDHNNILPDSTDLIGYCFAEKQGYSKFGSYTGNANPDGPFIYTGFKPAWVMIKRTDSAASWLIFDNKRPGYNGTGHRLYSSATDAEDTDTGDSVDLLSNGFKFRGGSSSSNANGGTYIYMAFAEHPFVSSEGVPTTAR
jgi:hypothetical protein